MMERRESNLTHRQRSNEVSLAWLLICTVGAALFAVVIATQGALELARIGSLHFILVGSPND
jgi:ABC-type transporter Mla maintaining outer membrane lipid asymmetry permease subunit MlaE